MRVNPVLKFSARKPVYAKSNPAFLDVTQNRAIINREKELLIDIPQLIINDIIPRVLMACNYNTINCPVHTPRARHGNAECVRTTASAEAPGCLSQNPVKGPKTGRLKTFTGIIKRAAEILA